MPARRRTTAKMHAARKNAMDFADAADNATEATQSTSPVVGTTPGSDEVRVSYLPAANSSTKRRRAPADVSLAVLPTVAALVSATAPADGMGLVPMKKKRLETASVRAVVPPAVVALTSVSAPTGGRVSVKQRLGDCEAPVISAMVAPTSVAPPARKRVSVKQRLGNVVTPVPVVVALAPATAPTNGPMAARTSAKCRLGTAIDAARRRRALPGSVVPDPALAGAVLPDEVLPGRAPPAAPAQPAKTVRHPASSTAGLLTSAATADGSTMVMGPFGPRQLNVTVTDSRQTKPARQQPSMAADTDTEDFDEPLVHLDENWFRSVVSIAKVNRNAVTKPVTTTTRATAPVCSSLLTTSSGQPLSSRHLRALDMMQNSVMGLSEEDRAAILDASPGAINLSPTATSVTTPPASPVRLAAPGRGNIQGQEGKSRREDSPRYQRNRGRSPAKSDRSNS